VFNAEYIQEFLRHYNGHLCGYDVYMCSNTSIIQGNLDLYFLTQQSEVFNILIRTKRMILQTVHKNRKIISIKSKELKLYNICGLFY